MEPTNCSMKAFNSINNPKLASWRPWRVVILVAFSLLINVLNFTVLLLYRGMKKTHHFKIHDIMLINQALGDLFNGVLEIPVKILDICTVQFATEIVDVLVVFSTIISQMIYMVMMTDQCLSVTKPLFHRKNISVRFVKGEFIGIWILTLLISLLPLIWKFNVSCSNFKEISANYSSFLTALVLIMFLVIVILVSITYNVALKWVRRRKENPGTNGNDVEESLTTLDGPKREIRVILNMCLMVCFYCIIYIPIIVMTMLNILHVDYSNSEQIVSDVSLYLYLTSSVFNPVVTLRLKFKDRLCAFVSEK